MVENEEAKKVVAEEEAKKVVAKELQAKRKELVLEQQVQICINAYTHKPTHAYIYLCKSELYMEHIRKGWVRRESHQRCERERAKKDEGLERDQSMGWLRFVGSLKLQVSFAKGPYKRDYSAKETYNVIILRILLIVATPYLALESSRTPEESPALARGFTRLQGKMKCRSRRFGASLNLYLVSFA